MAFDTKPNLSNDKFEQFAGETLTLSGRTEVHGTLEIENNGILRLDDGNQQVGFVLTSDASGVTSWQAPQVTLATFTGFTAQTTVDINYISGQTDQNAADISDNYDDILYISGQTVTGAAAPDTSVQFNNNGEFSGSSNLTFNNSTRRLDIVGDLAISGTSFLRAGGDSTTSIELGQGASVDNSDNSVAIGINAGAFGNINVAIGGGAAASGSSNIAIGGGATTSSLTTIAIGCGACAVGNRNIAIGREACTTGSYGVAIGNCAIQAGFGISIGSGAYACGGFAGGDYGTRSREGASVGRNAKAYGRWSSAVGTNVTVSGACSLGIGGCNVCVPAIRSIAIGSNVAVYGNCSIAIGRLTNATAGNSIAIGYGADAVNGFTIAMGCGAYADGSAGVAIGRNTDAGGSFSTAVGNASQALGNNSTSIGGGYNNGQAAIAIGNTVNVTSNNSIGIGYQTTATGGTSIAIGRQAKGFGGYSIAIGCNSKGCNTSSVAIGNNSTACGVNGVVLGANVCDGIGASNLVMGTNAQVLNDGSYNIIMGNAPRIGYGAVQSDFNVVLGRQACAVCDNQISIGNRAGCVLTPTIASQRFNNAISIGLNANTNDITIGQSSIGIGVNSSSREESLPTTTESNAFEYALRPIAIEHSALELEFTPIPIED
jgi:hypothetical protein